MRRSRPPASILLLTVVGFCTLYAPQPLLPALAAELGRSQAQVSLLITVTMLPLAVAPLVYGYVLEAVPARRMLIAAASILALCQAGLAVADAWWLLVLLRVAEGLALPALFTALMTFVAGTVPQARVRPAIAWYISATIVGGFSGRAISGLVSEMWNWRVALGIWAPLLLLMAVIVSRVASSQPTRFAQVTPEVFRQVLRIPGIGPSYLAILCIFFVFAAALNVLPFHMASVNPETTATSIGFAYLGYLSGLLVSLNADRLRDLFGSEQHIYAVGIVLYCLGLLLFGVQSTEGIYIAMFAFCGGMFLIHTRLSGQVNHLGNRHKGVVNGIYIAAYYFGGTLGSWLPGELYRHAGWLPFLSALGAVTAVATISLTIALRQAQPQLTSTAALGAENSATIRPIRKD